jgi:hypothetical protein
VVLERPDLVERLFERLLGQLLFGHVHDRAEEGEVDKFAMKHAIVGSGAIGGALAKRFSNRTLPGTITNRRGPASLADLARELGPSVSPAPLEEALRADVVILALPFDSVRDALATALKWNGRIVVDATNAIDFPAFTPRDLGGRPSSEIVAEAAPGARVVKAFNTLPAAVLASDPEQGGGRRVVFVSGNESTANADVANLIERLGFRAILLGKLGDGGRLQQFGAALVGLNLVALDDHGRRAAD